MCKALIVVQIVKVSFDSSFLGPVEKLHEDLFLHLVVEVANEASTTDGKTIKVSFDSLFLGPVEKLLLLMQDKLPELSLDRSNCTEMSWIQSAMHFAGFPISESLEVLLKRTQPSRSFFKAICFSVSLSSI
ncbi:unnamed protein product [Prunus armeniaca]